MRCPSCQHEDSRVIDSRTAGDAIRRRRVCSGCGFRFTTHERVELRMPWVVKKAGMREPWDREKLLHGLRLACRKRPITEEQVTEAALSVERRVHTEAEVTTSHVGEQVMEVLRGLDAVAYVRFASVYKAFESVEQFADAIRASARTHEGAPPRGVGPSDPAETS